MKNAFAVVAAATLVLGGALGLALSPQAHVALASTGAPAPAVTATPAGTQAPAETDGPSYTASIQVPNAPDGAEDAGND